MKKIAMITGGGSGLGFCLSEELLKQGFEICLVGRTEEKLCEAQKKLTESYGARVQYAAGSISDEAFVKKLFADLGEKDNYVQYLFNCAGAGQFGPAEQITRAMIDTALDASLIGLILMSSAAVAAMKEEGGTIVNIMSTAALRGKANETIYCAAKWGARGFTEALKEAVKGSKTSVIGVYPGGMNTNFWSPECGMMPNREKMMNPQEVAEVIVHAVLERKGMYVSDLTIDRK